VTKLRITRGTIENTGGGQMICSQERIFFNTGEREFFGKDKDKMLRMPRQEKKLIKTGEAYNFTRSKTIAVLKFTRKIYG